MGDIAKYTDLSWEIPGLRAFVDVPLEDIDFQVSGDETQSGLGPELGDPPDSGPSWDDSARWTGLEDFEQF
jgi:hypothetical protein